jgi:hypothetical protein
MNRSGHGAGYSPPPGGWWSPAARRLHLTLAIGLPACAAAGWFELTRALAGREIAWVYAGEWPLYGVLGTYLWWKLLHSEVPIELPSQEDAEPPPALEREPVDAGLAAWQNYLHRLHESDPPGGPPT